MRGRNFIAIALLAVLLPFAALAAESPRAQAAIATVNPPESVSPELQPYVGQFEQALRDNGFAIATEHDSQNLDLRLSLATSAGSITISSELLQNGRTLVATPVRNKTFFKESAIRDTAPLVAQRFGQDLARYVASIGAGSAGLKRASGTALPQGKLPVRSWQDVKVYFHPPDNRYEEIGLLEASSSGSWATSSQGKMDKVIERLRVQAAKKGANGVLLVGVGNEYGGSVSTGNAMATGYGNTAYGNAVGTSFAVTHKAGSAIAIYVYEGEQGTAPSGRTAPASQADISPSAPPTAQPRESQRADEIYDAILKLDDLRKRGLITDEEFDAEKQKVLSGN
jgi:hypothetical protein